MWKNQLSSLHEARVRLTEQVKSTAKTIAVEFQETAKELREAHAVQGDSRKEGNEYGEGGGVRFAFPEMDHEEGGVGEAPDGEGSALGGGD